MGEVVPGEYMTNTLHEDNCIRTLISLDLSWVRLAWEMILKLCVAGQAMRVSASMVELIREDEEEVGEWEGVEEGRRKGSSSTNLVLGQAHALQWAMPMAPEF